MSSLVASTFDALKKEISGTVISQDDEGYDSARKVWNDTVDKHPAVITRCRTTADVVAAVRFAKQHDIMLAVRGGGHNIAGSAVCDDALVIDLSEMKAVHVDPQQRRAVVEGGALLADMDAATQAHGLATPLGINSTTGVAGLTLGGGFGWLSRKYGMTIDNLLSAEVVTVDAQVLRASATEHPDLFWALRGGSGNFGVVTRFEFQLHRVGPDLLSGLIVYPLSQAKAVLQQYRDFIAQASDEMTVWVVLRQAPPLPFLPPEVHGTGIVALALLYAGEPAEGQRLIQPLREFGKPLGEHVGVQPYTAWQQAFDPLLTAGARNYWKSHNFTQLEDGLLDTVVSTIETPPSPHCEIFFGAIGAATTRVAPDAMAYAHRDANFVMNVHGRWTESVHDQRCIEWAREFFKASSPFASGGVYVNFLTADEGDRVKSAYGQNYERLVQVKRRYDPDNLFRTNQNIRPV
jgi:FAD/FMN-containing dehydrogenase